VNYRGKERCAPARAHGGGCSENSALQSQNLGIRMNTGNLADADACRLDKKPRPARWLHHPSLPALRPPGRQAPTRISPVDPWKSALIRVRNVRLTQPTGQCHAPWMRPGRMEGCSENNARNRCQAPVPLFPGAVTPSDPASCLAPMPPMAPTKGAILKFSWQSSRFSRTGNHVRPFEQKGVL
jgi:hypothetical protein